MSRSHFFLRRNKISFYMHHILFMHSFHTSVNIRVTSVWVLGSCERQCTIICLSPSCIQFFWVTTQKWNRRVTWKFCLSFRGTAVPYSIAAAPFYIPRGPSSSTPLPTLTICWCFGNSHPSGREAGPHGRDTTVLCVEFRA